MLKILVLYYSRHGNTRQLARHIARGIEQVDGCEAALAQAIGKRLAWTAHKLNG